MPLVRNTYSAEVAEVLVGFVPVTDRSGQEPPVRAICIDLLTGPVGVRKSKGRVSFVFVLYF